MTPSRLLHLLLDMKFLKFHVERDIICLVPQTRINHTILFYNEEKQL